MTSPASIRISCIIPTLNRGTVLVNTIGRLLDQSWPAHEIIVVDQTQVCDEATQQILAEWSSQGRIRWLHQSQPNASKARNAGALAATGEILLFLDDDIQIESNLLASYAEVFRHTDAAGVAGQVLEGDCRTTDHLNPKALATELGWLLHFPKNYSRPCETSFMISANAAIRRRHFLAVGGMDENYDRGAHREESDFAMRFRRAGYRLLFCPECKVYHLGPRVVPDGGARNGNAGRDFRYFHHCVGDWYFNLGFATPATACPLLMASLRHFVFNRQRLHRPWRLPMALAYWMAAAPVGAIRRWRGAQLLSATSFAKQSVNLFSSCTTR